MRHGGGIESGTNGELKMRKRRKKGGERVDGTERGER